MNCKNCGYGLKQRCGDFEKILCTYEEGECVKITELEQQKNWLEGCKSELSEHLGKANDRIVELEKKNTALRQDWEIMKNTIADYNDFCDKYIKLEKENAELKKQLEMSNKVYNDNLDYSHHIEEQLTKAKEIIKTFLGFAEAFGYSPSMDKFISEAEQFLKEVSE